MPKVLDLLSEFGALNDTKLRSGGSLPADAEARWRELKALYEHLMSQEGLPLAQHPPRFSAEDIRAQITSRERLRVPVEMETVFQCESEYHTGRVVNVSRGGVFLASETLYEMGSQLTLYLAHLGCHHRELFEPKGEVVWVTKRGVPEIGVPRGMGVQFVDFPESAQEKLESFVIDTIAKRLSGLW